MSGLKRIALADVQARNGGDEDFANEYEKEESQPHANEAWVNNKKK